MTPPSPTWHRHGARLLRRAPDPQLPEVIAAPAHDPATRHDGARVGIPRGDVGGGEAWKEGGVACECGKGVERVKGPGPGTSRYTERRLRQATSTNGTRPPRNTRNTHAPHIRHATRRRTHAKALLRTNKGRQLRRADRHARTYWED